MRPEIRWLGSADVDDLESWMPDSDEWHLALRILAGPEGGMGEESFDFMVYSLNSFANCVRDNGIVDGQHILVVDEFNWKLLTAYINDRVRRCEGANWIEISQKLSRLGRWEFED